MSATESLDEYIRKFQNDKGKYKPSLLSSSFSETITDTASSIDTEELLSETSSSSYSEYLNPKKRSKLKPENRKHKKKHGPSIKGLKHPSHLKPLHRTPLKIINEEDEFSSYMKYDISQYLPHEYGAVQMGNQDMRNYLPKPVNNQIGERVRNV
jgi:predicted restriction endonuclease